MCIAGHASVSPLVIIANTLSGEPQCAGYLGQKGGGWPVKEEGEEKRKGRGGKGGRGGKKSNGCLKIKEVRGIFYSEIFYAYPSLLLLLAFLPLSQPAPISHQVTASHHRLLCVY